MKYGLFLLTVTGCTHASHLSSDFGQSYSAAMVAQASFEGAPVNGTWLAGPEAEKIRIHVEEAATDQANASITMGAQ